MSSEETTDGGTQDSGSMPPRRSRWEKPPRRPLEFSLDREKLLAVAASLVALVLLVFSAGVLVGVHIGSGGRGMDLFSEPEVKASPPASHAAAQPQVEAPSEKTAQASDSVGLELSPPPAPKPKLKAPSQAPQPFMTTPEKSFTVQVGAFQNETNAKRYAAKLAGMGYSTHIFSGRNARGSRLYCVRIGSYSTRAEARRAAAEFKKARNSGAYVRPSGSL